MEFKDVVKFIIRHYRILILGLILGGALGLLYTLSSPAPYEATSKILISRNKSDKESDFGYLTDQQLIQTYAYILKTRPILNLVNEQINGTVDPDNVRVSQVVDTLILQIAVRDQNPQKAAYTANAFAKAMVTRSNQLQEEQYKLEEAGLTSQINSIRTQIDELQAQYDNREVTVNQSIIDDVDKQILAYRNEILTLQKEISLIKTPTNLEQESYIIERNTRLDEIQPLLVMYQEIRTNLEYLGRPYTSGSAPEDTILSRLRTTIDQYQEVNLTLLNSLEKIRLEKVQSEPTVQMIEEAVVPTGRTSLVFVMNPVIAAGVGLILAMLLGLVLDRKEMKISNQQQLLKELGLEVIGTIPPIAAWKGNAGISPKATVEDEEMQPFHSLRAFLEFHRIRDPYKSLLVTSFAIGDGKSTVASALAVNYVLGGDHVVLVDSNFINASQHSRFKTKNIAGLGDLLYRNQAFDKRSLKPTPFENLKLLPVGAYAPISMQLIDPKKMSEILESAASGQKLVIVDGPPLSDLNAMLLASAVDKILLVIRTGVYSLDGLAETLNDLAVDRKKILGVVLNEPVSGVVEIQALEDGIAASESEKTQNAWNFMSGMGVRSQPSNKELVRMDITSEGDVTSEDDETEVIPSQFMGGDEPGVVDQSEFVSDSSQERIFTRLFHFPGLVTKKQGKKEDDPSAEKSQGGTHGQPVERVEPFVRIDLKDRSAGEDCNENEDTAAIMQDSEETRSILSWLKFWQKPKEQDLVDSEDLMPDPPEDGSLQSNSKIWNSKGEQEPASEIQSMTGVVDPQAEIDDPPAQTQNLIIEKTRQSLEPIWNQLQKVLRLKKGINTVAESVEPVDITIDGEADVPIAADVDLEIQKESVVMQSSPARITPKRVKKVEVSVDVQQEIPGLADVRGKARKTDKKIKKSEPLVESILSPKLSRKGRPPKAQKQEVEPKILEKSVAQEKSSARGKLGKTQILDAVEKKNKKADSTYSIEKSSVKKTKRVSSRSASVEDSSRSQKADVSVSKAKKAASSKKAVQSESKDETGTIPTSSNQGT